MTNTELLTRKEAAAILRIKPQTLAIWACNQRYNMPFIKIGSRVMYCRSDVENFLKNNYKGGHYGSTN